MSLELIICDECDRSVAPGVAYDGRKMVEVYYCGCTMKLDRGLLADEYPEKWISTGEGYEMPSRSMRIRHLEE